MYLDVLICAFSSVITSSEIVALEGTEYSYTPGIKATAETLTYTFGGRLEQIIGFRNAFREVCSGAGLNDLPLLIHLYLRLVQKYCTLFRIDSFLYTERGLGQSPLRESLKHFFLAAAEIDEFGLVRTMVHDMVLERFHRSL
jgi:hypothetical protein